MERALRFAKERNLPVFAWKKSIVLSTNILGDSVSRESKKRSTITSNHKHAPASKQSKIDGEGNVHDMGDGSGVDDADVNVSVGSDHGNESLTEQEYADILSTDSHLLLEIFVEGNICFD